MLIHIEHMRLVAIETLFHSYRVTGFPLSLIKAKLNLCDHKDAESLIKAAGYYSELHSSGRLIVKR